MRRASIMSSTIWSAVHNRNNVFRDFFFLGGGGSFFFIRDPSRLWVVGGASWVVRSGSEVCRYV